MKNIFNVVYVLFLFIMMFVACGQENLITDTSTEDTRIKTLNSDNNLQKTNVSISKTDANKNRPEYITQLIVEPPVEILDDVVEVIEENVEDVDIEDNEIDNVEINDVVEDAPKEASTDNMVVIESLSLYVDKYELSIDEYCEVYPEMFDTLIQRILNLNDHWRANLHPQGKYPALLYHDEAVEYGEIVGKRLPKRTEWLHIAKGNGNPGVSNMNHNRIICVNAQMQMFHVVNEQQQPNGYGVYEMMGNVTEHNIFVNSDDEKSPSASGLIWLSCAGNVKNWFPHYVNIRREGVRYVVDIE